MRRRELMLVLGGAMIAGRALRAQQKAMAVIGVLGSGSPGPWAAPLFTAFRQGLSETGYVEGQNLAIEYRWANGRYDRLPALAAELVGSRVDVIVTYGASAIKTAKSATSTIPIVFFGGGDPVASGLVASLSRPGGNLTGVSIMAPELNPKRLDLLSELVPQAGVIALLANPNNSTAERTIRDLQEAGRAKGAAPRDPKGRRRGRFRQRLRFPRRKACWRGRRRQRRFLFQPARAACGLGGTPRGAGDL
jgi:ABC-type uncharacterized transport system substrate-binding protein